MEMRKQALEDERRRREDLEKRLQEETSRRQKLIDREVKLREKQRAQVSEENMMCTCLSCRALPASSCRLSHLIKNLHHSL